MIRIVISSLSVGFVDHNSRNQPASSSAFRGENVLVVISRSLCECHMNAKPRSLPGLACTFEGCKLEVGRSSVPLHPDRDRGYRHTRRRW